MRLTKRGGFTIIPEKFNAGPGKGNQFFRPPEQSKKRKKLRRKKRKKQSAQND